MFLYRKGSEECRDCTWPLWDADLWEGLSHGKKNLFLIFKKIISHEPPRGLVCRCAQTLLSKASECNADTATQPGSPATKIPTQRNMAAAEPLSAGKETISSLAGPQEAQISASPTGQGTQTTCVGRGSQKSWQFQVLLPEIQAFEPKLPLIWGHLMPFINSHCISLTNGIINYAIDSNGTYLQLEFICQCSAHE